jgi:glycine cleavage system H protein
VTAIPEELRYTSDHEWLTAGGSPLRMGITHFAQDALGDIVYVQLPEPGTEVQAGQALGEVESTKSVSEIYAPIDGTVVARNDALTDQPDLVNSDPYGDGWLVEIEPAAEAEAPGFLDANAYRDLTDAA